VLSMWGPSQPLTRKVLSFSKRLPAMTPFLRCGCVSFACSANLEPTENHKAARGLVRLRKFSEIGQCVPFNSYDLVLRLAVRGRADKYLEILIG